MADIFKDKELELALEDLSRSVAMCRIGNIDRDPATYIKLMERMGALSMLLVKKLITREVSSAKEVCAPRMHIGHTPETPKDKQSA